MGLNMLDEVDTYYVGTMSPGLLNQAIEDVRPTVIAEARLAANGRTISLFARKTLEGNQSFAHVFVRHDAEPLSPPELTKTRTRVTEDYKMGVYDSPHIGN